MPLGGQEPARAPDAAAAPGERGRLDRAARRPALGRASAAHGDDVAPEHGLAAAQAARPGPAAHAPDRLRARARRRRSSTSPASSGSSARRARPSRPSARSSCARRSRSGAARRSPTRAGDFAQAEIRRLEDLRLGVLEERIAADLEVGADAELVASSRRSCARIRCGSGCARHLMLALYRSGRQADALAAYHDARRTLVDELGIEPGPELQALYGSILRQERSLVRASRRRRSRTTTTRCCARSRPGGSCPCSAPARAASPATSSRAARRALRARRERPRPRVRVAGRRGAQRDRPAARRAAPRARPRLRAVAAARLARGAAAAAPRAGLPQQLIVSTGFDTGVERAFEAAGEELDVVVYVAAGRDRGKFCTSARTATAVVVERAECLHRLRARGAAASSSRSTATSTASGTREWESFAVCEDDHIDYLVGGDAAALPGAARGAPASQPPTLPRLRGRRLEPACLPAPRLGRRPPRVPVLGGPAGARRWLGSSGGSAGWRSTRSRSTPTPRSSCG